MNTTILIGKRVMVCEDEMLVSMLIEDILSEHACILLGPFTTVPLAQRAAQTEDIDAAILDVNLHGHMIYPVAEVLAERGIPFVFLSGYGQNALPSNRPSWRACSKPFRTADLVKILVEMIYTNKDERHFDCRSS